MRFLEQARELSKPSSVPHATAKGAGAGTGVQKKQAQKMSLAEKLARAGANSTKGGVQKAQKVVKAPKPDKGLSTAPKSAPRPGTSAQDKGGKPAAGGSTVGEGKDGAAVKKRRAVDTDGAVVAVNAALAAGTGACCPCAINSCAKRRAGSWGVPGQSSIQARS